MASQLTVFQQELAKLILEEIDRGLEHLETNPFTDTGLPGVRYVQGKIVALRSMATFMEEAARNADQSNR